MTAPHLPRFPLGGLIEQGIQFLERHIAGATQVLSAFIDRSLQEIVDFVLWYPAPLMIALFAALGWWLTRKWGIALFVVIGLGFVWNLRLWEPTVQTLALVVMAAVITVAIGLPLGILAAIFKPFHRVLMPILDFMQTLPAFVYLIPAIPFFGLGTTSALFSTVIFSMPPVTRLTTLGLRGVPGDLMEAADAFGSTTRQKLFKVQLPVAADSIRTGVNQTIMLSLSMVVIAAMIGAKGLGAVVWKAIQRLDPGMGFEAGIGIVILAIVLDRIMRNTKTQAERVQE
jgi:glycine betaine/proline transport system permease protein